MGWSIRKKLIIFLMIVTVLPFGASIAITYYHTKESLKDRFVSTNHDVIENGKKDIATYLQDVAQMTTRLYGYSPFMNVLRDGVSSDLRQNQEEVNRILMYLFHTRPEIEQIHLYIHKEMDSYTIYHSRLSGRGKYEEVYKHPYYFQLGQSSYFTVIEPPHRTYSYNNLSVIPESEKRQVLSFHNMIKDVPSDRSLGFLSIDINLSSLRAIADRLYTKGAEDFYVMNENGIVVYSSEQTLIGAENKEEWFEHVKESPLSNHDLEWKDDHFSGVIVHEKFSGPFKDWYIVKRIPYDLLYESARETAFINILIGIITLVIVVLATMIVSFKFTSPIKVLIANMKRVEKGEFEVEFDSLGNDEFGMLGRHFKSMVTKINDLIQREYRLEIENKSTQLRVLQSQINPHFLYNALQSIGTLALKHKAVPVYSLLTSLSNIMRYSMNMKEDVVSFVQEVQHVKSYLSLQKQRFGERFEYELEVQEQMNNVLLPKMILQPIVENCFKYGFDQKVEKGFIYIKAFINECGTVCIKVQDNGKGVNEERLESIQNELAGTAPADIAKREAIGLKNIYDRLNIYYSDQAKMVITSRENEHFTITIEIPAVISKEVQPS
ncbi:two-component system sensor histidine kinase YesM [Bacillus fengqiuensis]|nr:two-component system sensor histidine kinase YesM [Bacillus fengqiuensis]